MFERSAPDVRQVLRQAHDIARRTTAPLSSVHLLLAMFVTSCRARDALAEVGVDEQKVIAAYRKMRGRVEPATAIDLVIESAHRLAASSNSVGVDSMVLLASLLKVRKALAARVLREAEVDVAELRVRVIGQVTLGVDRASSTRIRIITGPHKAVPTPAPAAAAPEAPPPPEARTATAPTVLRRVGQPRISSPSAAVDTAPEPTPPLPPEYGPYDLDPAIYPTLAELGRNMTAEALAGELPPLIGREGIVEQVVDILMMKQANNPCLVGDAGVGKTAIVEGLAAKIAGNTELYGRLGEAIVVELHVASLLAGTSYRGTFSERMTKLRGEVQAARGRVIVFVDEVHTLMGAGSGDGALDAANDLKTALARGKFPLIGATTPDEYRLHIEKDTALHRRFQQVDVPEPTVEEALRILAGVAPRYAEHHGIPYSHNAVVSAVHLSKRFISDRCLPDKAISMLDRAGSQARRRRKRTVEADDVARAVQAHANVPMQRLLDDERTRIRNLYADLQQRVVGQDRALERIAARIKRNFAGFSGDKPLASFVLAGPPGVGKTEAAKAIAQALFVVDDAVACFDMKEYAEAASAARLIGSPPGYVGHQQRGLLADALHRRPYRVLLFEEVERAAPEVLGLVAQILERGRLTDNHGVVVDMRNCIVVLTTVAGSDAMLSGATRPIAGFRMPERPVGLTDRDERALLEHVRACVGSDIVARVDETILFRPLDDDAGREVARRSIARGLEQLYRARLIRVTADDSVLDFVLADGGIDPRLGARGLHDRVEQTVIEFVAQRVVDGELRTGSNVLLAAVGEQLVLVDAGAVQPTAPTATDALALP